jgi:hypothetical protein
MIKDEFPNKVIHTGVFLHKKKRVRIFSIGVVQGFRLQVTIMTKVLF